MYLRLRRSMRTYKGKTYTNYQLVEAVCTQSANIADVLAKKCV
jgi:hypothetical protein